MVSLMTWVLGLLPLETPINQTEIQPVQNMMQKSKSAHRMQCKQVNMQSSKAPNDKHTSARIDSLSPDQQQVAESPVVATAKINRAATNIFILKIIGIPVNHKTKQRSHDQRRG